MQSIDLHCHSAVSDGVLAPAEVVDRAHANGATMLALTDHDEVAGLAEASERAKALGIEFVNGVEISVTWAATTIHIVGLHVNANDTDFIDHLRNNRSGRFGRGKRIGERFEKLGIPGAYEGALRFVTNPSLMSRKHFARFLVEQKHCRSMNDAFERYLKPGKPAYVNHEWATLEDAMRWIDDAGGQAVMAHPGRYPLSHLALVTLLDVFKDLGGIGMEVVTGSHSPDQYLTYGRMCQRYGFLASVGSDFHAPGETAIDVGCLPDFPCPVTPIWQKW